MNKKGEIQYLLIPLIAFLLASASIYSMISMEKNSTEQTQNLRSLQRQLSLNQEYVFAQAEILMKKTNEECKACSPARIKSKFQELAAAKENEFRYEGAGNFYGKIRNGEFEIEKKDGKINLAINQTFVEAREGVNNFRRDFDLQISLNS